MQKTDVPTPLARAAGLIAVVAALGLAGCVTPPPPAPPPPPPPPPPVVKACDPPREAQDLAARHLLAADLTAEAARSIEGATIEQQMDQALALSMTHANGDLVRAQTLLDQVLHNNAPQADPWRGLARLLAYRLGEQKRAEDAVERGAQQLREAQRDNQRKLDDANAKLEALKAIERSLNTRQGPPASSPRP